MKNALILIFLAGSVTLAFTRKHQTRQLNYAHTPIAGTYTLIAVDNILADGTRVHLYGASPQGLLIFDDKGHYSLQIMSGNRPKFAAGDKGKGTDAENKAAVQGCNTHFGTYAVDEEKRTITFNILHASFPNWEGVIQKRAFTISGDTLKYSVPSPTTGGAVTGEVIWERNRD